MVMLRKLALVAVGLIVFTVAGIALTVWETSDDFRVHAATGDAVSAAAVAALAVMFVAVAVYNRRRK